MKSKNLILSFVLLLLLCLTCQAQAEKVPGSVGTAQDKTQSAESPSAKNEKSSSAAEADCLLQHNTNLDFFDSLRIRPIKVTSIEGSQLFYNYQEKLLIEPASVVLTEMTDMPENFRSKHEGKRFFLVYCLKHFTAQIIQPIGKTSKTKTKKEIE